MVPSMVGKSNIEAFSQNLMDYLNIVECLTDPIFVFSDGWEDALLDWLKVYTLGMKLLNVQSRLIFIWRIPHIIN